MEAWGLSLSSSSSSCCPGSSPLRVVRKGRAPGHQILGQLLARERIVVRGQRQCLRRYLDRLGLVHPAAARRCKSPDAAYSKLLAGSCPCPSQDLPRAGSRRERNSPSREASWASCLSVASRACGVRPFGVAWLVSSAASRIVRSCPSRRSDSSSVRGSGRRCVDPSRTACLCRRVSDLGRLHLCRARATRGNERKARSGPDRSKPAGRSPARPTMPARTWATGRLIALSRQVAGLRICSGSPMAVMRLVLISGTSSCTSTVWNAACSLTRSGQRLPGQSVRRSSVEVQAAARHLRDERLIPRLCREPP